MITTKKQSKKNLNRFNHIKGAIWGILKYHFMIIQAWQARVIVLTNFKSLKVGVTTIKGLKDLHLHFGHLVSLLD